MKNIRTLVGLAALAFGAFAQAGHWQVTYSGGVATSMGGGQGGTGWTMPYSAKPGGGWGGGGGHSATGTITATFEYIKSGPTEVVPDLVRIEESSKVQAHTIIPLLPQVNDGLGGTPTVESSPTHPYQLSGFSSKKKVSYKVTGGERFVQITCSPSATGTFGATVEYTAKAVDLAAAITATCDESFHKDPNTGLPVSNFTQTYTPAFGDVGVLVSDAVYFSMPPVNGIPGAWVFDAFHLNQTFTRELFGPWWDPFHEWKIDGVTYKDSLVSEYESVATLKKYSEADILGMSQNGPITRKVKLKITDDGGDGEPVEVEYDQRVHAQYEKWENVKQLPNDRRNIPLTYNSNSLPFAGNTCAVTWDYHGGFWSEISSKTQAFSTVVGPLLPPYVQAGFALAGLSINDLIIKGDGNHCRWAWNEEGSTIVGGNWNVDFREYEMVPRLEFEYKQTLQKADHYGRNGYIGVVYDVKAKAHRALWMGDFRKWDPN